ALQNLPGTTRGLPKTSVEVAPTNTLDPASIVGLPAVSWTSPTPGPGLARPGLAQILPAPGNGAPPPIAQTSLLAAVTLAPGLAPKPSRSEPPRLPVRIVFCKLRTSVASPSAPADPPVPDAWLPETVELTSVRL